MRCCSLVPRPVTFSVATENGAGLGTRLAMLHGNSHACVVVKRTVQLLVG